MSLEVRIKKQSQIQKLAIRLRQKEMKSQHLSSSHPDDLELHFSKPYGDNWGYRHHRHSDQGSLYQARLLEAAEGKPGKKLPQRDVGEIIICPGLGSEKRKMIALKF